MNSRSPLAATAYVALFLSALLLLSACGSSSSEKKAITVAATLEQGAKYSYATDFGDTPFVVTPPANGSLAVTSSQMSYTPKPEFSGTDYAKIEADEAYYEFNFTVQYVNQPPTVASTNIAVVSDRVVEGKVVAIDPDDDPVSFALLTAPERGTFTFNEQTGDFSYTQDDLRLPNATFTISLSDGINEAVTAEITLLPAYTTNEEKSAYYYHSSHSHLLQAELRIANLASDIDTFDAYIKLAEGYVLANLPNEATRILASIVGQQERAIAYSDVAERFNEVGQPELAQDHRQQALALYTQYVVDNGVENFTANDGSFFLQLLDRANNNGDLVTAERIAQQMDVFINALDTGEYNTPYGRLTTAYRNQANGVIDAYKASGEETDRLAAVAAAQRFANVVERTGYQMKTSGPNKGKRLYQIAPLYNATATENFILLGEPELARRSLAITLSYYRAADYDADFNFPEKPYAAVSLEEYKIPLQDASGLFDLLYPTAAENLAFALIPESDATRYKRAQEARASAAPIVMIANGESNNDALAQLEQSYVDDPKQLMASLAGVSETIFAMGYDSAASVFLTRARAVIGGADYFAANSNATLYTTGNRGCNMLIQQSLGQEGYEVAEATAKACEAHFIRDDRQNNRLDAIMDASNWYLFLADRDPAAAGKGQPAADVLRLLRIYEPLLAGLDEAGKAIAYGDFAALAAHARGYTEAMDWAEAAFFETSNALAAVVNGEETALIKKLSTVINSLEGENYKGKGIANSQSMLYQFRGHAYNEPSYQSHLLSMADKLTAQVETFYSLTQDLSPVLKADNAKVLVPLFATIRAYQRAETVAKALTANTADQLPLLAQLSAIEAVQDDFPSSTVASVDTDKDGRANFYSINSSSAERAETDIGLDDDADGDGILDEVDPCPLGCA